MLEQPVTAEQAPRVAVYTLGCKLNYAEGLTIRKSLENQGYEACEFEQGADVYIINTCSVTDRADRKCAKVVHQALRHNPRAVVAVVGCYAQLQPGKIAEIPGVALVAGTADKWRLAELLPSKEAIVAGRHPEEARQAAGTSQVMTGPCGQEVKVVHRPVDLARHFQPAQSWGDRTRAFLKVQDGCDFPCTYCTIPLARGMSRSDLESTVVARARELAGSGALEIVLTGVNLGDFGRVQGRLTNPFGGLAALVRRLQQEVEVPRFRLSSVEPNLFEHDLILALKDSPRFVPHFHIPLQSGSDSVLGRMQRRYRTRNYRALLLHLQETWQDAGLGADVLVGFPGESEAEFRETLDFVSEMPLAYLHVFTYSERPDTPAAAMRPKVPQALRLERNRLLTEVSLRKQLEFARRFEGQKRPVLVEHEAHRSLENPMSTMRGYTPNYLRVEMPYDPLWAGTEVMVEVGKATLRDQEVFVQGRILESTPLD